MSGHLVLAIWAQTEKKEPIIWTAMYLHITQSKQICICVVRHVTSEFGLNHDRELGIFFLPYHHAKIELTNAVTNGPYSNGKCSKQHLPQQSNSRMDV